MRKNFLHYSNLLFQGIFLFSLLYASFPEDKLQKPALAYLLDFLFACVYLE